MIVLLSFSKQAHADHSSKSGRVFFYKKLNSLFRSTSRARLFVSVVNDTRRAFYFIVAVLHFSTPPPPHPTL